MLKACQLHTTSATGNATLSHTHKHIHVHTRTLLNIFSCYSLTQQCTHEDDADRQITCIPKNVLKRRHACLSSPQGFCTNRLSKPLEATPTDRNTQYTALLLQDSLHHLLSSHLLVLHTFLSPIHSSRCSPNTVQHQPSILHTE